MKIDLRVFEFDEREQQGDWWVGRKRTARQDGCDLTVTEKHWSDGGHTLPVNLFEMFKTDKGYCRIRLYIYGMNRWWAWDVRTSFKKAAEAAARAAKDGARGDELCDAVLAAVASRKEREPVERGTM